MEGRDLVDEPVLPFGFEASLHPSARREILREDVARLRSCSATSARALVSAAATARARLSPDAHREYKLKEDAPAYCLSSPSRRERAHHKLVARRCTPLRGLGTLNANAYTLPRLPDALSSSSPGVSASVRSMLRLIARPSAPSHRDDFRPDGAARADSPPSRSRLGTHAIRPLPRNAITPTPSPTRAARGASPLLSLTDSEERRGRPLPPPIGRGRSLTPRRRARP